MQSIRSYIRNQNQAGHLLWLRKLWHFLRDYKKIPEKIGHLKYYLLEFPHYRISLKQMTPCPEKFAAGYKKRTVTIITAYNRDYKVLGDMAASQIRKYCARYNFGSVIFETENLSPRPYPWITAATLYYTLSFLTNSDPEAWVVWIDADAVIVNLDFNLLTEIIQKASPKTEIFFTKDFNGVNTGVALLKNTRFVKKMLEKTWSLRRYVDHPWWWQRAVIDLIDRDWRGIRGRIQFVPQHILNAYTHVLYGTTFPEGELTPDSFIYHIPGQPLSVRIKQAKRVLSARASSL